MFESLYATLHTFALTAGFWGVVFISFAQEVIPPLPSTVIAMSLGFLLIGSGVLSWGVVLKAVFIVGIPMGIGLTLGALVIYGVFYWGGKPLLTRYGKFIGVSWSDVEQLQQRMQASTKDELLFFGARALPIMPSSVLNAFAGIVRWRIGSFIALTFCGATIRGALSALVGWGAGSTFMKYAGIIEQTHTTLLVLVVLVIVGFVLYRKAKTMIQLKPVGDSSLVSHQSLPSDKETPNK